MCVATDHWVRFSPECVAELAVGSLLTPALFAGVPACRLSHREPSPQRPGTKRSTPLDAYAAHSPVRGGPRQMNLASLLRFCAVAVSNTSSLAPLKPRGRRRSSLRMRFICANLTSTFLRSRHESWKASVLARARTCSRTSSSMSRETLRARSRRAPGLELADRAIVRARAIRKDAPLIDDARVRERRPRRGRCRRCAPCRRQSQPG